MNNEKIAVLLEQLSKEFRGSGAVATATGRPPAHGQTRQEIPSGFAPAAPLDQIGDQSTTHALTARWDDLNKDEQATWLNKMQECLDNGDASAQEFFGSMRAHYTAKNFLTEKQRACIEKSWNRMGGQHG